ncbi:IPT/TIG domain-containing protein [Bacteroides reticulotermitis]|uniref:IPT/TIG domain-containing protein n=1 Tax=Bacteroides reticulotermitis TaxID=1133319 RepID=UPI003A87A8EF
MRKHIIYFLVLALPFILGGCKGDNDSNSNATNYDPNKPVTVDGFMPENGKLREKVIVKGSNFGNDKSKVKVYFVDGASERLATIINLDNQTIYCLAPRQLPGENRIKVVVDDKEVITDEAFEYEQAQNVSTIAGTQNVRKSEDGTLAEASFEYTWGIGAVGNNTVLVFQRDNPRVRLVSVNDNKVATIHPGFKAGKPAVTKDRQKVYAIGWEGGHTIYMYTKGTGWAPTRIGQLGAQYAGRVLSAALDASEEWLYFVDANKKFARFNVTTQEIEDIATLDISGSLHSNGVYIVYHPIYDCFFMSNQLTYSVYRLEKDGKCQVFAGSSTQARVQDGYREDAYFAQPNGMAIDEDGNFFIVEGFKAYVLRKISVEDGYVSTVAGMVDVASQIDGTPLEATFNYPYDICYDGEGGFWIAEGWGQAVRKYAVE